MSNHPNSDYSEALKWSHQHSKDPEKTPYFGTGTIIVILIVLTILIWALWAFYLNPSKTDETETVVEKATTKIIKE